MTMSVVSTQYCISDGSILVESNIVSFSAGKSGDDGRQTTDIFSGSEKRQLPAAPFDNPGAVSFHYASKSRKTIFVRDLGDHRLSLTASIPVALDFWNDSVTACCYDLEEFGVGEDEFSAIADLKATLVELYFTLKAEAGRLGPLPQRHWDYLTTVIREN